MALLLAAMTGSHLLFEYGARKPASFWTWSAAGEKQRIEAMRNAGQQVTASEQSQIDSVKSASEDLTALRPWAPLRWCDLAEQREAAGDMNAAARLFEQATTLAGDMPLAWMRRAGFHWRQGDTDAALDAYRHALILPSKYRPSIYVAVDGLRQPAERLFQDVLRFDEQVAAGYLRHKTRNANAAELESLWDRYRNQFGPQGDLAADISRVMWKNGSGEHAYRVWATHASKDQAADQGAGTDLASNPRFSDKWLPTPFAWQCDGCGEAQIDQSEISKENLGIVFPPQMNRRFDGLKRTMLLAPGNYTLQYKWKHAGDDRIQGTRFIVRNSQNRAQVFAQSTDMLEAKDWQNETLSFSLNQPMFVELAVARDPYKRLPLSKKSTLWLSSPVINATARTALARNIR